MDELLGTRAQPERWSRSESLCAEVGTGRAVLSPCPFPRSGSLPPLRFGQFFLDEAEHFLENRMASVAMLRGCSGSSRNVVRLRRNPHHERQSFFFRSKTEEPLGPSFGLLPLQNHMISRRRPRQRFGSPGAIQPWLLPLIRRANCSAAAIYVALKSKKLIPPI